MKTIINLRFELSLGKDFSNEFQRKADSEIRLILRTAMAMKLIYLCSELPGISHTFVLREIETLRQSDFEISTVSVNPPRHLHRMTPPEKQLAAETLYLKKTSFKKLLQVLFTMGMTSPGKMMRMAQAALSFYMLKGQKNIKTNLGYFLEAVILVDMALRRKTRHIHVHFANPAATVALIASQSGAVEYSLSIHGPDVFYDVGANLLREKVSGAIFVRCISHYCRSQLCRLTRYHEWSKLSIVRCGIDLDVFSPRPFPSNSPPNLLCVGRLTANKGQHVLIEACALLKKNGVAFHLTFVGDGEDRDSLEDQVKSLDLSENITFTGAMGQDRVKELYASADIFILPSFAEGVPVVLMEAMAMEIPVISTCITGIPELIESGDDGILTVPGDSMALFEKTKLLLQQPQLRIRLGRQARKKIAADYHLENNCRALSAVFRERLQAP